jgi:Na+/melibiose symporter-like transporter
VLYDPVPALFLFASFLVSRRFPLTRETQVAIHRALDAWRFAGAAMAVFGPS